MIAYRNGLSVDTRGQVQVLCCASCRTMLHYQRGVWWEFDSFYDLSSYRQHIHERGPWGSSGRKATVLELADCSDNGG